MIDWLKEYIIDMCVVLGIYQLITATWRSLEWVFDGKIQPSTSDTVIGIILTVILWILIRKWYVKD